VQTEYILIDIYGFTVTALSKKQASRPWAQHKSCTLYRPTYPINPVKCFSTRLMHALIHYRNTIPHTKHVRA